MNNETHRYHELANFLKTRRSKISPSQVGLRPGLRRRTPGLRREEVAQLAGVGLTWYTWLEQGRPIHVSTQVIESLAKVLLLNKQERLHLYTLLKQPLPTNLPSSYQGSITPLLQHVLDNLEFCPSFIMDQRWNILAWNQAACSAFIDFNKINTQDRNMVWMMFTNSYYKQLFIDWEFHAQGMLGRFRSTCSQYIEDPWLVEFIHDLKSTSEEFDLWWPQHDVQNNNEIYKKLQHPIAGILVFEFSSFNVSDNSGLTLIVNTPDLKTDTTLKMKSLMRKA